MTVQGSAADRYLDQCPLGCATELEATDIALPEGPLLRCTRCGQLLSQVSSARYWDSMRNFDSPEFNQPSATERERRYVVAARRLGYARRQLRNSTKPPRLLDIGCSRGDFVATALRLGFAAEGVEPAAGVAAAARVAGLTVHTGLLEDIKFPAQSFDVVTLFEVIEHLRELVPLLRECHRILRPGGVLVLSTGNAASWTVAAMKGRWDYFHIEKDAGHISFFNPGSLRKLAGICGFDAVRIITTRVRFCEKDSVPTWLYALAKISAELLSFPARLFGKGHDMVAFLRPAAPKRESVT